MLLRPAAPTSFLRMTWGRGPRCRTRYHQPMPSVSPRLHPLAIREFRVICSSPSESLEPGKSRILTRSYLSHGWWGRAVVSLTRLW